LLAQRRTAQTTDIAEAQRLTQQLAANTDQLTYVQSLQRKLTLPMPFDGTWLSPKADTLLGSYAPRGTELGTVQDTTTLHVRAVAPQWASAPLVQQAPKAADIRARMRPQSRTPATVVSILAAGQEQVPTRSLTLQAGGSLATDPTDPKGQRTQEPFFEVRMQLTNPQQFSPGQRVVARLRLQSTPLLHQGWRWLRQQVQRRFEV
jgi:hypothetical protein